MCGRCFPCSLGSQEAKTRLIRLGRRHLGNGSESDIEALKRIAFFMMEGSYCKKGRDTGKFLLETVRASEEEFRMHLSGVCPKNECISLTEYMINPDLCIKCGKCLEACRYDAVRGEPGGYEPFEIRQEECTRCGACMKVCPTEAIEMMTITINESGDEQKITAVEGA
jgi:NADH-quinone oxidoreductase subunit F